jgi:hypothetical protein
MYDEWYGCDCTGKRSQRHAKGTRIATSWSSKPWSRMFGRGERSTEPARFWSACCRRSFVGNVAVDTTVRTKTLVVSPTIASCRASCQTILSSAPTNNCIDESIGHGHGDSLRAASPTLSLSLRSRLGSASRAACDAKQKSTDSFASRMFDDYQVPAMQMGKT